MLKWIIGISTIYLASTIYVYQELSRPAMTLRPLIKLHLLLTLAYVIILLSLIILNYFKIKKQLHQFMSRVEAVQDSLIQHQPIEFNITEDTILSKLEHQLKQLHTTLNHRQLKLNEEKITTQELISDISHQIKTPIANIKMYEQTLQRDLTKQQQDMCLGVMDQQIQKLEFLIEVLVKMSRLETGIITVNPTLILTQTLVDRVVEDVKLKADTKGITIITSGVDKKIWADLRWSQEALLNVVDNAIKYSEEGCKIEIDVMSLPLYTKIVVKDNGSGVDQSELNDIFKRFYRGRSVTSVEGVGVGLYLTREILQKQGGYITADSKLNQGSVFTLYFLNQNPLSS